MCLMDTNAPVTRNQGKGETDPDAGAAGEGAAPDHVPYASEAPAAGASVLPPPPPPHFAVPPGRFSPANMGNGGFVLPRAFQTTAAVHHDAGVPSELAHAAARAAQQAIINAENSPPTPKRASSRRDPRRDKPVTGRQTAAGGGNELAHSEAKAVKNSGGNAAASTKQDTNSKDGGSATSDGGTATAGTAENHEGAKKGRGGKVRKNHRTKFEYAQVKGLEAAFEVSPRPSPADRILLSETLGLSESKLSTWFQNRRARQKQSAAVSQAQKLGTQLALKESENAMLRRENEELRRTAAIYRHREEERVLIAQHHAQQQHGGRVPISRGVGVAPTQPQAMRSIHTSVLLNNNNR